MNTITPDMEFIVFDGVGAYATNFVRPMSQKTLDSYMKLINDGSPSSGTHWSRCRGPQRIFAKTWSDNFNAKRRARNQARKTQAAIYCAIAIMSLYTLWIFRAWK